MCLLEESHLHAEIATRQMPKWETATMTAFLNIPPEEALWFFDQRGVLGKVSVHTCLNSQVMCFPPITDMRAWKRRSTSSTCRWSLSLWKWQLSRVCPKMTAVRKQKCSSHKGNSDKLPLLLLAINWETLSQQDPTLNTIPEQRGWISGVASWAASSAPVLSVSLFTGKLI